MIALDDQLRLGPAVGSTVIAPRLVLHRGRRHSGYDATPTTRGTPIWLSFCAYLYVYTAAYLLKCKKASAANVPFTTLRVKEDHDVDRGQGVGLLCDPGLRYRQLDQ